MVGGSRGGTTTVGRRSDGTAHDGELLPRPVGRNDQTQSQDTLMMCNQSIWSNNSGREGWVPVGNQHAHGGEVERKARAGEVQDS